MNFNLLKHFKTQNDITNFTESKSEEKKFAIFRELPCKFLLLLTQKAKETGFLLFLDTLLCLGN